jgi:hypothetical protein
VEELGPLARNHHLTIMDCFTLGKGDGSSVFSRVLLTTTAPTFTRSFFIAVLVKI